MPRKPSIRFLGSAPAATGNWYCPKIWIREPRLMVPRQKPIGPVKIDWCNSLTNGLTGYWLFDGEKTKNLANYADTTRTVTGTVTRTVVANIGAGVSCTPSGNYLSFGPMSMYCAGDNLSLMVHVKVLNDYFTAWGATGGGLDTTQAYIYGNGYFGFHASNGSSPFVASNTSSAAEKIACIVGSVNLSTVQVACNGNDYASTAVGSAMGAASSGAISTQAANPFGEGLRGVYFSGAAWKRCLSQGEMLAMSADPYQFLIPD